MNHFLFLLLLFLLFGLDPPGFFFFWGGGEGDLGGFSETAKDSLEISGLIRWIDSLLVERDDAAVAWNSIWIIGNC